MIAADPSRRLGGSAWASWHTRPDAQIAGDRVPPRYAFRRNSCGAVFLLRTNSAAHNCLVPQNGDACITAGQAELDVENR